MSKYCHDGCHYCGCLGVTRPQLIEELHLGLGYPLTVLDAKTDDELNELSMSHEEEEGPPVSHIKDPNAPRGVFEREKADSIKRCSDCGEKLDRDGFCPECEPCMHEYDPSEGYTCLNCGKDGSEEALAAIYDRMKDGD